MTTTTHPAPSALSRLRPLRALARAEYLQFRRNRTLMFMGTAFPIGIPLLAFVIARRSGASAADVAVTTLEMFAFIALVFVQYYSVLSLVTTRRGEGVLKRLRTGEASDWQIKAAPAVPGALLTLVGAVVMSAIVYGAGAPAPVNVLALLAAVVGGLAAFTALALVTAAFTKNAEAAQVTSLPVMAIATAGLASIRSILPERFADIVERTPMAAVGDLISLGADGRVIGGSATLDLVGTLGEMVGPVVTLVAWTAIALVLAQRNFRWDDRG